MWNGDISPLIVYISVRLLDKLAARAFLLVVVMIVPPTLPVDSFSRGDIQSVSGGEKESMLGLSGDEDLAVQR